MRRAQLGGTCGDCGARSAAGLYWTNYLRVLDFWVPGMAPVEPDTTQPVRCDECEAKARALAGDLARGG